MFRRSSAVSGESWSEATAHRPPETFSSSRVSPTTISNNFPLVASLLALRRIIKFYAWESPFRKAIEDIRESELVFLTKLAYISAIGFSMIMLSAPIILPIVVFAVYIATSNEPLDAATAFTTVALFNIMRFPFAFMPMGFLQYIQAKIAMGRIDFLLTLPELEEYVVVGEEGEEPDTENEIIIENSPSFSWGVHEKKEEEVRQSEERSDELITSVLGTKIAHPCTFVQNTPPPQPPQ